MTLWERPAVEAQPVQSSPFGEGVADVDGSLLRASMDTLTDLIAEQVRAASPMATAAEVRAAQDQAVAAWIGLLNQSIGDTEKALSREELSKAGRRYSFEFDFLAKEYGRLLSGAADFAARSVANVIPPVLVDSAHDLDVQQVFAMMPWAVRRVSQAEVRVVASTATVATVEWHAEAELARLRPEDHRAYLHMCRDVYTWILSELPRLAHGLSPAKIREEQSMLAGDPYFRWHVSWRVRRQRPVLLLLGLALSVLLIALAQRGTSFLAWVALLPAVAGALGEWGLHLRRERNSARNRPAARLGAAQDALAPTPSALDASSEELKRQVDDLKLVHDVNLSLGAILDRTTLMVRLLEVLTEQLRFDRALLLLVDEEHQALVYGDVSHPAPTPELQFLLESLQLPLDAENLSPLVEAWRSGETMLVQDGAGVYPSSGLGWAFGALEIAAFLTAPLCVGSRLIGVMIVDNSFTGRPLDEEDRRLLSTVSTSMAIAMDNARLYSLTDAELSARVAELRIQQQIDQELNASLRLDRVMTLTMDWALRFTNATAGSLSLYDPEDETLRLVDAYDYPSSGGVRMVPLPLEHAGVSGRVVRTGEAQIVDDVTQDPDYVEMAPSTRSQVSVPILLENSVVGVMTLESSKPAAFSREQVDFAQRLADRAAAAIENTRLFDETRREREKLSTILANTADGVIVVGAEGRLEMVNVAARAIFRLDPKAQYRRTLLADVFGDTPLLGLYARAVEWGDSLIDEIELTDNRTYHVRISPVQDVGWVAVMQDITHFKEIDRLKSELVATVSHDLKNPLNVMSGYAELIDMRGVTDERASRYLNMIRRSASHMRQLIDDLLDLARIESGITLELTAVEVQHALQEAADALRSQAEQKDMHISVEAGGSIPPVLADRKRLRQILINLIDNAIKYTPPEGRVCVSAEIRDSFVLVSVADNGLGIAPEDQAKVFSRFYRVRRPEMDNIEGTGLGLAIVKSLVEAHGGEVGLESRLGEGSAFHFTIPRADD